MITKLEDFLNEAKKEKQDDKWIVKEGILADAIADHLSDALMSGSKKGSLEKLLKEWEIDGYKMKEKKVTITGSNITFDIETPKGMVEISVKVNAKMKK